MRAKYEVHRTNRYFSVARDMRWHVLHVETGRTVQFRGTKRECLDWIAEHGGEPQP